MLGVHTLGSTPQDSRSEQDPGKSAAVLNSHSPHFQTLSLTVTAILVLFRWLLVNETNYKEGILVFDRNTALLLLSSHSTFWKLGISYLLFTEHNSCRSNVILNLNCNYSIVPMPSFLLKGKFIFHFFGRTFIRGLFSMSILFKKKSQNLLKKVELGHFSTFTSHLLSPAPHNIKRKFELQNYSCP